MYRYVLRLSEWPAYHTNLKLCFSSHAGVIGGLRMRTGFSPVEIFRKYMWYLLRERKFDQEAVADMVHLKHALGLKDGQVSLTRLTSTISFTSKFNRL